MIAPLALAFQLATAAAAPPGQLLIRTEGRTATVPIVATTTGLALRIDLVAASLGGTVRALPNGHFELRLPGVVFDVAEQVPVARDGDHVMPMSSAPFRDAGVLYVPLQLLTEHLPSRGTGVLYDARLVELRLFAKPLAPGVAVRAPAGGARQGDGRGDAPRRATGRPDPVRTASTAGTRSRRRVVIDAGHGGRDGGMHGPIEGGPQIHEKDITLAVSRRLAAELRARGVDVIMTRTADTLIALSDRGRIANASRADLFMSVHVNAANPAWKQPGAARGFETYFLAEAKTEDARRVEQMENEAVRFETGADAPRGDPLSFIINDMAQNEHLRESSDLAAAIQDGLDDVHPGPNRGVKQANFAVLRTSFMPAVLVELGFGTNREEARLLGSEREQRRLAIALADATMAYLARYERRVGGNERR